MILRKLLHNQVIALLGFASMMTTGVTAVILAAMAITGMGAKRPSETRPIQLTKGFYCAYNMTACLSCRDDRGLYSAAFDLCCVNELLSTKTEVTMFPHRLPPTMTIYNAEHGALNVEATRDQTHLFYNTNVSTRRLAPYPPDRQVMVDEAAAIFVEIPHRRSVPRQATGTTRYEALLAWYLPEHALGCAISSAAYARKAPRSLP